MKTAPSLLTSQAFFSIWAPFAFCQDLAISCTNLFQGKFSLKDYSLLNPASGCQVRLPTGRVFLALPPLICLLQAEQVAGIWQCGKPTSWSDPKLARKSQVPLATSAMSRERQSSWKPVGLSKWNLRKRRIQALIPSTGGWRKKRYPVMLSFEGIWFSELWGWTSTVFLPHLNSPA